MAQSLPQAPGALATACEGTPPPQAVRRPLRSTLLSAALLSGFLILITSCPHLPAAAHHAILHPRTQFGVKALLISQSGSHLL